MKLRKCQICGTVVEILEDCHCENCEISCCGKPMFEEQVNSKDASFEKHLPAYERKDKKLIVKVNHVMEEEHFIEWISLCTGNKEERIFLTPGREATVSFDDVEHGTLYAYCNKHGLWKVEVE